MFHNALIVAEFVEIVIRRVEYFKVGVYYKVIN